jgi:hypothetical protein
MYRFVDKNERCDFAFNEINDLWRNYFLKSAEVKSSERLVAPKNYVFNT